MVVWGVELKVSSRLAFLTGLGLNAVGGGLTSDSLGLTGLVEGSIELITLLPSGERMRLCLMSGEMHVGRDTALGYRVLVLSRVELGTT